MARALLGLKADVEGTARSRTSDPVLRRARCEAATASGFVGHGAATAGGPGVHARARDGLDRDRRRARPALGAARANPRRSSSSSRRSSSSCAPELADEPGREHVLAVHRHDDGRRAGSVSLVVEASAPTRIVERDLTSSHEADVVTTIEPCEARCPADRDLHRVAAGSGPGRVVDGSGIAALMRTRLAVVKNLAEAGRRRRSATRRTGFLAARGRGCRRHLARRRPPAGRRPAPVAQPVGRRRVVPVPGGPPARTSLPSSVLLPPPHVAAPAAGYDARAVARLGRGGLLDRERRQLVVRRAVARGHERSGRLSGGRR